MSSNSNANWPPRSSGGGGGTVTGASNVGAGVGVFKALSGTTLQFKSLIAGTGLTWTANANDLQGNVSLAPFSTTNLAEGTNLYYTQARFDTAFAAKTTTNLAEGTNLYYTQARFDTAFAAKSTTNLAEGTNLYYTQARFDTAFAAKTTTDLAEGSNLYWTAERTDDRVAALIQTTASITWTYNDPANTLSGDVSLASFTTTDLAEGTNLYFTVERAQDAVGGGFLAPLVYNDGANTFSITQSTTSTDGYLSSVDWNTFNNKPSPATVAAISSNVSLANNFIYLVNTSAPRTLTLPSPVTGIRIVIKDSTGSASTNPIALTPFGAETIDTVAGPFSLNYDLGSWEVVSDGSNWYII